MATFQDYIKKVGGTISERGDRNRSFDVEIDFLRTEDESVYKTVSGKLIDGSISLENQNLVRRTTSFTLDNSTLEFTPSIDGDIWVNRKFALKVLYDTDNGVFDIPLGVYIMNNPQMNTSISSDQLSLGGVDKGSALNSTHGSPLDTIFYIPVGTNMRDAVQSVITASGDTKPIIFDETLNSLTTVYDIYVDIGSYYEEALQLLSEIASADYYYNVDGNFVFEADVDDSVKGVAHRFYDDDNETNISDISQTKDFQSVKNRFTVFGANVNGYTFTGVAENNDLTSDTSIPNIGVKSDNYTSDILNTQPLVDAYAEYLLKRSNRVETDYTIDCTQLFHLQPDQVVELNNSRADADGKRILIQSASIGLKVGDKMSIKLTETFEI